MAETTESVTGTIMCIPDLSDHPGPITRAQLILEIGTSRVESRWISPASADRARKAIVQAFRGQIVEKDNGFREIM